MDPNRFRNSTAGRVIQVGQRGFTYWAFVPNPLPPAIDFDAELATTLSEASLALGELAGLGRTIRNPDLLVGPFIRREAVLSSRIEGTETEISNLYAFEAGQLSLPGFGPSVSETDVREVLNYVNTLKYGIERLQTFPLSKRLICELHERLMAGVRGKEKMPGEFRNRQNWIGRPGCTLNEADFVPPPVPQMQEALNSFEVYLHEGNTYPLLIQLALIHYQFEVIHPFIDGNGRIGRLLIPLLLVCRGVLPLPLLYLSAYFERNRLTYYDLLMTVSEHGDWRAWVVFFLQAVTEQAQDASARAKQLQNLHSEWQQQLQQTRKSALLLKLVDSVFEIPVLTIPQARRSLGVTYASAKQNMDKLVEAGILEPLDESSHGKVFWAPRILRIVSE